jgi:hypothetical protein
MKKVLVLTYYWPPSGGAGVQRWLKFVKYMRDFGWEPIVYTAQNGEMPVVDESLLKEIPEQIEVIKKPIWEPYSIYKKFIGRKKEDKINASFLNENKKTGLTEKISVWIRGNFFIPDARKFWIKPSIRFLSDYVSKNEIKVIISSGPPHSMHLIALGLKSKHPQIKWLADFRDPWTNIDFYDKLMLSTFADAKHKRLEKNVLQEADIVVSVGNSMSEEFKEIVKQDSSNSLEKFKVITNGFDTDDLNEVDFVKDTKFSLAHIGTLVKDRNPEILWKVLSELIRTHKKFEQQLEIKLVGKVDYFVMEQMNHYGLKSYLKKIDYLPHNLVIQEQKKSHVLLLLVNHTKNAKGILTGKIFEYLAANVPILAIGPTDGDLSVILKNTNTGLICDFKDERTLKEHILTLFEGYSIEPNQKEINKFSRRNLTKELCNLLNSLY